MKYFALISLVFLAACNTTGGKPVDISTVDVKNPYLIGYYVTYSNMCGYFSGNSADKLVLRSLTEKYEDNKQFKKGYELNSNKVGADRITNLHDCDKAKAIVNAAYEN
ncbi:MAG: hypothetical protein V7750_03480 [Sneathiella sp.]